MRVGFSTFEARCVPPLGVALVTTHCCAISQLDASIVQEYAAAASADGATTYGNQRLASLGSSGRHKGNIRRDLYNYTIKEYELTKQLDLYDVEAEFATKDCLGTIVRKVGMFLPHELFAILYSDA